MSNQLSNMRPIDFVVFDGGSSPNTPAYKVAEAMLKQIIIQGENQTFQVLSYYINSHGQMVIDIEPIA